MSRKGKHTAYSYILIYISYILLWTICPYRTDNMSIPYGQYVHTDGFVTILHYGQNVHTDSFVK